VKVASAKAESIKAAIAWIKSIANDPEVGHIYEGTVVKVMDFGAFVNFFGAKTVSFTSRSLRRRVNKVPRWSRKATGEGQAAWLDDRGKTRSP